MQFRNLKEQYHRLKKEIDAEVISVMEESNFISGYQVMELEKELAQYVGTKYCVTCANGTDALQLALMAWNIGVGDAVFVPDFTFFSSGEVVKMVGATPIFVDIDELTYNIDTVKLENAIQKVQKEGKLIPKVVIAVDLFGQPAEYCQISKIAKKYNLYVLEDGAQGFGGRINEKKACSFGDISTTSFFPAKPLGCYGDGGAIFTDDKDIAEMLYSLRIHGKGKNKYDNIRIGLNSRLDTIQAVVLQVKLKAFREYELDAVNEIAKQYTENLKGFVQTPTVLENYYSSWAQYCIVLKNKEERDALKKHLEKNEIPSNIYYPKPMHYQEAFVPYTFEEKYDVTEKVCKTILAIPISPYITIEEVKKVIDKITECLIHK